jgi:MoaA/NifB/PqqE/SkfB family radical SAM enzyme
MSLDDFRKIASDIFWRTRSLYLSCGYEPLLVKHFDECLIISKEYRIPFVSFATNGMLLDKHLCQTMVRSLIDEVVVSADGASPSTFESIRRGASFSQLLQNLRQLQELKKSENSKKPILRVNYTFMDRNISEIPEFIEKFSSFGMEVLELRPVKTNHAVLEIGHFFTEQGMKKYNQIIGAVQKICRKKNIRLLALSAIRPPEHIVGSDDNEHRDQKRKANACILPWTALMISSSGGVTACLSGQEVGNILETSYDEIMQSYKMQQFLRAVKESNPFCSSCPLKEEIIA